MMLFVYAALTAALAADIAPREASVPIRVFGNNQESVYHKLAPGRQLTFDTQGPGKWTVDLRQRITAQDGRTRGTVIVLGNGKHRIMTIPINSTAQSGTRIDDARGGAISKHERAIITVPAAGKFLTLTLEPGSHEPGQPPRVPRAVLANTERQLRTGKRGSPYKNRVQV